MDFVLETNDLGAYLKNDDVIDADHPSIRAVSAEVTPGLVSDIDKAKALFDWVRDTIPHTRDADREEVTCAASHVLSVGTGICYAKAHLLAALLRYNDIPAGFCYQVYWEKLHVSDSGMALHGLNGIYLRSLNRWIRVDCRGNKDGVDAQFNTETEQIAFPEDQFLDNRIYARPLPQVVKSLETWPTRTLLWPHLPGPTV
jgi:transglutaminase-like putative cysteine protease